MNFILFWAFSLRHGAAAPVHVDQPDKFRGLAAEERDPVSSKTLSGIAYVYRSTDSATCSVELGIPAGLERYSRPETRTVKHDKDNV